MFYLDASNEVWLWRKWGERRGWDRRFGLLCACSPGLVHVKGRVNRRDLCIHMRKASQLGCDDAKAQREAYIMEKSEENLEIQKMSLFDQPFSTIDQTPSIFWERSCDISQRWIIAWPFRGSSIGLDFWGGVAWHHGPWFMVEAVRLGRRGG